MMPEQQIKKLEQQLLSLYQQGAVESYSEGQEHSLLNNDKKQQAALICQKLEYLYGQVQPTQKASHKLN